MTEAEHTQLLEGLYEAWNRDEFEAVRPVLHPEVEWRSSGRFPGLKPVYRGHEGVREWWHTLKDPFESFTITLERIFERGGRTFTEVRFEAVGRESGAAVDLRFVHAFELEGGLIVWYASYASLDEALAALG